MKDKSVLDQVITLEPNVDYFLGPNLRLLNCKIVSNAIARNIFFSGVEMTEGFFEQGPRLENFHFEKAHFNKVKFCGDFAGCDFGDWDNSDKSSIVNCDFVDANMNDCRFLNTDMRTISLPAWPHFSLHSPVDARDFSYGELGQRNCELH
ncbi:hypothetical protein ACO0LL_28205 [Undibacterium sp. TC4M20W]|uniref:hypothetical protein n=1 Tax=unclassified Undibacterium TaxID=2630295 RepID=UPI003BF05BFB